MHNLTHPSFFFQFIQMHANDLGNVLLKWIKESYISRVSYQVNGCTEAVSYLKLMLCVPSDLGLLLINQRVFTNTFLSR